MKTLDANEKYIRMTQAPVEPLIGKLAVPTVISMLISTVYNMVDTYFIGKINTSASGAVGVAFSVMALIQALGFFFGQGSGVNISQELGRKEHMKAQNLASTAFFLSLAAGTLLSAGLLLFLRPATIFLGATDTILPYAMSYLRILLLGAPFMVGSLVLNNQFRFVGNAVYGMVGLASGAVLNMILDPLFIFTFQWGIAGAAAATVCSQLLGFVLLLIGTHRADNIPIRLCRFTMRGWCLAAILRGGLPSFCRQGVTSAASICLNIAAKPFGDPAIAAMAIVAKIMNFSNSAIIGLGQGFQPVCGFNYGAGLYDRVKKAFFFCVKCGAGILIVAAALEFIFAPQLIEVFRRGDPEVVRIGALALRLRCITLIFSAWSTTSNMMMQTMGRVVSATLVGISRQGILLIPLVFLLPRHLGVLGIQLGQPIADVVTFLIAVPIQLILLRHLSAKKPPEPAEQSSEP